MIDDHNTRVHLSTWMVPIWDCGSLFIFSYMLNQLALLQVNCQIHTPFVETTCICATI
jgi:hypothetical protein